VTAAERVVAQLDALLAATPAPRADAEPDELIDAHAAMAPARVQLIAELTALAAGVARDPRVRARYDVLAERDRAWVDALVRARAVVGDRMTAVRRARAYR
jgi:hypothetical protein